MARGSVRPGSRISPPVKVTLFQADCENSGPIMARPSKRSSADAPSNGGPGKAVSASQPLAGAFHHDDVQAAHFAFGPSKQAHHDQPEEGRRLGERERVLDPLPKPQAPHVHRGEQNDQRHRNELLSREADGVARPHGWGRRGRRRRRSWGTKTPRNLANATATAAISPV